LLFSFATLFSLISIPQFRSSRGWTQARLAKEVQTTQSSIARLENMDQGLPSLSFLKRVADALGASIEVRIVAR
jgi:transcriptional regulator with XRE-family HTH domain